MKRLNQLNELKANRNEEVSFPVYVCVRSKRKNPHQASFSSEWCFFLVCCFFIQADDVGRVLKSMRNFSGGGYDVQIQPHLSFISSFFVLLNLRWIFLKTLVWLNPLSVCFFFLLRIVLSLLLGCPQRAIVHHRPPCHPTNPARLPLLLSPLHIGGRPDKYLLPFCYNLCFNTIHYVLFWSIFF